MKTLTAIATALTLMSAPAMACDSLQIHIGAWHSDAELYPEQGMATPGIGCRFDDGEFYYEAGVYHNSIDEVSLYGIFNHKLFETDFGYFIGAATGYGETLIIGTDDVGLVGGLSYSNDLITLRAGPTYDQDQDDWGVVIAGSVTAWSF